MGSACSLGLAAAAFFVVAANSSAGPTLRAMSPAVAQRQAEFRSADDRYRQRYVDWCSTYRHERCHQ